MYRSVRDTYSIEGRVCAAGRELGTTKNASADCCKECRC